MPDYLLPTRNIEEPHFPGFVYEDIRLHRRKNGQPSHIEIVVAAHAGIAGRCSRCLKPAPGYDQLPQRSWLFVPLWGMVTGFVYAARRVKCPEHGGGGACALE